MIMMSSDNKFYYKSRNLRDFLVFTTSGCRIRGFLDVKLEIQINSVPQKGILGRLGLSSVLPFFCSDHPVEDSFPVSSERMRIWVDTFIDDEEIGPRSLSSVHLDRLNKNLLRLW